MSPFASVHRPLLTSQTLAEQFGPIVAVHDSVRDRAHASVDVRDARMRIRAGRAAFDAAALLRNTGDVNRSFHRVASAFERTGVESSARLTDLRGRALDVTTLMVAWANGDSMPRDPAMHFARSVAGVVANAVLAHAASSVTKGFSLTLWKRNHCPCCGAAPDLVIVTEKRRALICWRCDTTWRTEVTGCLGCGEDSQHALFRVPSPYQGYVLAVCNSCGRYVKERRGNHTAGAPARRACTDGWPRRGRSAAGTPHLIGVIVAGGGNTRFGGEPKGLRTVGGQRIIDRVAAALRATTDDLMLSANANDAEVWLPGVRVIRDVRTERGSLVALEAALRAAAGDDILAVAWDMPFVTAALLGAIRARLVDGASAAVPESAHGPESFCAAYAAHALPVIEQAIGRGELRVAQAIASLPRVVRIGVTELAARSALRRGCSSMGIRRTILAVAEEMARRSVTVQEYCSPRTVAAVRRTDSGERMPNVRATLAIAALTLAGCHATTSATPSSGSVRATISSGSSAGLRAFIDSLADAPEFSVA